jgi:type II secretory ATPase GspE/PulE/Tfp pilus assembly ATPase PilB-like protein
MTGYRGRTGLYELLEANDEVRKLVAENAQSHIIKHAARAAGMRTLREDGWRRVVSGITSVEEVLRATKAD